uniref:Uncharacterized protein n=1 Tax=Arundo donax TaxID=35708 RepID=A0A0A9HST6_ARUDO
MSLRKRATSPLALTTSGTPMAHSNASLVAMSPAPISRTTASVGKPDDMTDTSMCSAKLGAYFSLDHLASSR